MNSVSFLSSFSSVLALNLILSSATLAMDDFKGPIGGSRERSVSPSRGKKLATSAPGDAARAAAGFPLASEDQAQEVSALIALSAAAGEPEFPEASQQAAPIRQLEPGAAADPAPKTKNQYSAAAWAALPWTSQQAAPIQQSEPGAAADPAPQVKSQRSVVAAAARVHTNRRTVLVKNQWLIGKDTLTLGQGKFGEVKGVNLLVSSFPDAAQPSCLLEAHPFKRARASLRFQVLRGGFSFRLLDGAGKEMNQEGQAMRVSLPAAGKKYGEVMFEFEPQNDENIRLVISNDDPQPSLSEIMLHNLTVEKLDDEKGKPRAVHREWMTARRFFSGSHSELIETIALMALPSSEDAASDKWMSVVLNGWRAMSLVSKNLSEVVRSPSYKLQVLAQLDVPKENFPNINDGLNPNIPAAFKAAMIFQKRFNPFGDGMPSRKNLEALARANLRSIIDPAADLGHIRAIERRIVGYAKGIFGFPYAPSIARKLNNILANKPGPAQDDAIERRIVGCANGEYGYRKSLKRVRRLVDELADKPGPSQAKNILRRIEGYLEGKWGFPKDPAKARQLDDDLADQFLKYQALERRILGSSYGMYDSPIEPEKAREIIDTFVDKPGPFQWIFILKRIYGYEMGFYGYPEQPEKADELNDALVANPGPFQIMAKKLRTSRILQRMGFDGYR